MPGLTNEHPPATHQGIIDQNASGSSNTTAITSSHADVYIIPDYTARGNTTVASTSTAQHLLVLPFVPHPSSTTNAYPVQPPPHYFCSTNRASTPAYNEPPPEYEASVNHQSYINHGASFEPSSSHHGMTPSCSCLTQLTSVADDYGEYAKPLGLVQFSRDFILKCACECMWDALNLAYSDCICYEVCTGTCQGIPTYNKCSSSFCRHWQVAATAIIRLSKEFMTMEAQPRPHASQEATTTITIHNTVA